MASSQPWISFFLLASLKMASANDEMLKMSRVERLEMSTEFFIIPERGTQEPVEMSTKASVAAVVIVTSRPPLCQQNLVKCLETSYNNQSQHNPHYQNLIEGEFFRRESWVLPLLIMSSLTMFLIIAFEIFVLCKARRTTPSRRHLFLGQMLLLGLFMCAGLATVVAKTPTPLSCATIRFGTGLAFAIVFSSLLVKCVFLISLNSGVYLPAPYQALLLLFAILIQTVVGVQWLFNSPPSVDFLPVDDNVISSRKRLVMTSDDLIVTSSICHTPYTETLLSLLYVVFLILFVAVLAIKSRGIRDNYREATYIGLAVGFTIPMWIVWALTGLVLSEIHRDACLAFGLATTSFVIFIIMFMPKGRQLAAMGKEGVYFEDRDDRFSSLSPGASGYSPSFFHFKPVKYGIVDEQNMNTQKNNMSGMNTIGDQIALVTAPPSYTRMYHYFPPAHAQAPLQTSSYHPSYYPPCYPGGTDFYPKSTFTATRYHSQYFATPSANPYSC